VEIRQRKSLFFVCKAYFDFIVSVESTYVKNLTLTNMIAHLEGDLILAIDNAIRTDKGIQLKFLSLFDDVDTTEAAACENISEEYIWHFDIMHFVLDRYRRMRGQWFVKYLKSNQGKSLGDHLLDNATTSTKVSHAAAASKAKGAARKEAAKGITLLQREKDRRQNARKATDGGKDAYQEMELWDNAAEKIMYLESKCHDDELSDFENDRNEEEEEEESDDDSDGEEGAC
jgi:hypothetical protein